MKITKKVKIAIIFIWIAAILSMVDELPDCSTPRQYFTLSCVVS